MKSVIPLVLFAVVAMAQVQNAKEISVDFNGEPGAIHIKGTLAQDGKDVRLDAVAVNNSGAIIENAKLCVVADTTKKTPCLFTLWNTQPWKPGAELSWDLKSSLNLPDLWFDIRAEAPKIIKPSPTPTPAELKLSAQQKLAVKVPAKGGKMARLYDMENGNIMPLRFGGRNGHGWIEIGLENGDKLNGEFSAVPKGTIGFGSILSSVNAAGRLAVGSAFGMGASVNSQTGGHAIAAGNGTVIECEFFASALNSHGYGGCKDNYGKLYELMF